MVKLYDSGAYLLHGTQIVAETAPEAAAVVSEAMMEPT